MDSSSQASPPPLDLRPSSRGRRQSLTSPASVDSLALFQSQRTATGSSASTNPESISPSNRKTSSGGWVKASPTVNVHTTCGRHTDQLLFGGPSLRGFARALLGKNKK